MGNRWGNSGETVSDFIFLGSKITADGECSHEIKRHLLLGRQAMSKLDSILKSCDITWPTKVHLVKAMVFPVVMYGCAAAAAKSLQSCPTLCHTIDSSPPGSSIHGICQARVLEWGAIAFSSDQPRQHIKKQRHYFANKGPSSKSYGFSSSRVWCESWTIKKTEH